MSFLNSIFISCSFLVPLHYYALKLFPSLWYDRKIKPLWIRLSSMYFEIKKNLHLQPFLEQNTKCWVYVFICISMDPAIFREIWCMTISNQADKNFPVVISRKPHLSPFTIHSSTNLHWSSFNCAITAMKISAPGSLDSFVECRLVYSSKSNHTSCPGDEGISNNQRNQPPLTHSCMDQ